MSQIQGDIVQIPLRKRDTSHPWGFKIEGGHGDGQPLFISEVTPKGVAEQAGLRPGDFILSIGKCDVSRFTQNQFKAEMNRAGIDFLITLSRNSARLCGDGRHDNDGDVVEESVLQFNDDGTPYQDVSSVSTQKIHQELKASEKDSGPRPSSIFDRRKQDRSPFQGTTGISYQRAYGRPK